MRTIVALLSILFLGNFLTYSQTGENYMVGNKVLNATQEVDPGFFQEAFIEKLVFMRINEVRTERGFDPYEQSEILTNAAKLQADYMVEIEDRTLENKNKNLSTTSERLQYFGGSGRGLELIERESIKKRGIYYTYKKLADNIAFEWFNSGRDSEHLYSDEYTLMGIGISLGKKKRRVYISMILGNFLTDNNGAKQTKNLAIEVTQPAFFWWKRLEHYDDRACRRIDRLENLSLLQSALTINDKNEIYLDFDNARPLKRFLRERKDGLAIDIISKDQYLCGAPNKVDYSLVNRGMRLNPVYSNEFWRKNEIEGKYVREVKVPLGKLPDEYANEDYELNLLLIQDNHVCKSIPASFLSDCEGEYKQPLKILADTITINSKFDYHPVADSTQLSFRIPFEKKKYTYRTEDIEPFLKLLNEPDFLIYELNISAFSSIEGIETENTMLQKKRAQSIVNALRKRQKDSIISEIKTEPAWDQFRRDIQSTQHNVLASMSMQEAQDYIRKYNLSKKLEPILKKHRYAQIDMKVTYDISGPKEQEFVISKFNKAIDKRDLPLALSIQKYIMKKVMNGQYPMSAVYNQEIPEKSEFAGLLMNKLWLEMKGTNTSARQHKERIAELHELDRYNEYIAFNHALCRVKYEPLKDERQIEDIQNDIDRFYYKSFTKETVDNLNMRFQFKVINAADSLNEDRDDIIEDRLEQIKEIVDITEESIENSLRLAELFIQNKDYAFAIKMLDAFVESPAAPEDMVFTYLSLCSRFGDRLLSRKFARIMRKAYQINADRYCMLFDGEHFSYRVFENPYIKQFYCEECGEPQISNKNNK
ncbi:CAP domain-containing protein [Salinivirga cyanobacteriivorans]